MMIDAKKEANVIALEEPENHLSPAGMRTMISLIQEENKGRQFLLTSHNSKIVSGVGLKDALLLSKDSQESLSLANLPAETSNYFRCVPNDSLLSFVLAKKVILVEGPSEVLYFGTFYEKLFPSHSLEKDQITIIPVNGLAFEPFIAVANVLKKRVALVTDNDAKSDKKAKLDERFHGIYSDSNCFQIFMEPDMHKRTFEICLYQENSAVISNLLTLEENADYSNDYAGNDRVLGKMLNEKTKTALFFISKPRF